MRKDLLNDFNEDELKDIDAVLEISPTMREHFFLIILLIFIGIYSTVLYKTIPLDGYWLDQLLHFKLTLLHKKITYNMLVYPIRFIGIASYCSILYIYLKQKFTIYKLTDYDLEIKKGIIAQTVNVTAWVHVDDEQKERTFADVLLGLGRVFITSKKDKSDPILLIKGLSNSDAEQMMNYIRKNAIKNLTELRLIQEKQKMRQKHKNKDKFMPLDENESFDTTIDDDSQKQ
jgi:hypothetical protein